MRNDNYPDDIRQHDNMPGSPFYEDPDEWIEEKAEEMANEWCSDLHQSGRVEFFDWDLEDFVHEILEIPVIDDPVKFIEERVYQYLFDYAAKMIKANPEEYMPEPDCGQEWD